MRGSACEGVVILPSMKVCGRFPKQSAKGSPNQELNRTRGLWVGAIRNRMALIDRVEKPHRLGRYPKDWNRTWGRAGRERSRDE